MKLNEDLEFILLFEQITFIGKISSIINQFNEEIKPEKFFDIQQLLTHEIDNSEKKIILITEYDFLEQFEDFDIDSKCFNKIICIGNDEIKSHIDYIYINKKQLLTGLISKINKIIKDNIATEDYIPINIKQLPVGKTSPCDLYIKLKNNRPIKILSVDQDIDTELIVKYKTKEIDFFFIKSSDYDIYSNLVYKKKTIFKKKEEEIDTNIDAIEALHTYAKDLGFDDKIIKQTQDLLKHISKNADTKVLKGLLNKLTKLEGSFLYNHSFITATLALTIGRNFNWFTVENQEKVYLGSMLHDLGLENENNAIKEMLNKEEIHRLDVSIKKDIMNHTNKYSDLLSKTNLHQDVINIITKHHGMMGPNSYPRPIATHEATLIFALFMISHDFTVELFKCVFNKSMIPGIVEKISKKYIQGNFKTIIPEFTKAVEETFL